jgi:hypothetical protein
MTRKCVILGTASHTASPNLSSDLLPEGYDSRYDVHHKRNGREDHTQVHRKNLHEMKQNHDSDEQEHARNSNRSQSHDEVSYTPSSASLPPECGFGQCNSPVHLQQQQQVAQQHVQRHHAQTLRIQSQNGAIDKLGLYI